MLTASDIARAIETEQQQDEVAENRRVIEEQAKLRWIKYGIEPEGTYDWSPQRQATRRANLLRF